MHISTRQLRELKARFRGHDEYAILCAAVYVQKQLNLDGSLDAFFASGDNPSETTKILDEIFSYPLRSPDAAKNITADTWEVIEEAKSLLINILPNILQVTEHLKLKQLTNEEASELAAKLTGSSSFTLSTSEVNLELPEEYSLQGVKQAFYAAVTENNNPEHVLAILEGLFTILPETVFLPELKVLQQQAQTIVEVKKQKNAIVNFAREKLALEAGIESVYIQNALTAFNDWLKRTKAYPGLIIRIIKLTDELAFIFRNIKKHVIEFCYTTLCNSLTNTQMAPSYFELFANILNNLTLLEENTVLTLCKHIVHQPTLIKPALLFNLHSNETFKQLAEAERAIILKFIATLLENETPCDMEGLYAILNKCGNKKIKTAFLRRLNEFYQRLPFPSLDLFLNWAEQSPQHHTEQFASKMAEYYVSFHRDHAGAANPPYSRLTKQLSKLKQTLMDYQHTWFNHTRKTRAADLETLCDRAMLEVGASNAIVTTQDVQRVKMELITELYCHYASIENASGILSQNLEKRLLKLLNVPKDDVKLIAAKKERDSFGYKLHTFFMTGRGCFKSHRDKAQDPVHAVIRKKLPVNVKVKLEGLHEEMSLLDKLDNYETSLFQTGELGQGELLELSKKIAN